MKFLQVATLDDTFLDNFYRSHGDLWQRGFHSQIDQILADGYAGPHLVTPSLAVHGMEAALVVANSRFAQARWLKEQSAQLTHPEQWIHEVVRRQVGQMRPDVLHLTDSINFDGRFLDSLPVRPRLVVGWHAGAIPQGTDWRGFDLLLTSHPETLQGAVLAGAKRSALFLPGFPSHLARELAREPKVSDIVFSGQVIAPGSRCSRILADVAKLPLAGERAMSLSFFIGNTAGSRLAAGICMNDRGALRGKEMLRALAQGRIVLDAGADPAESGSFATGVFEATGCGSFVLADSGGEAPRHFQAGRELETFSNAGELKEKINYYLDHEREREEIAQRGQQRCLNDYSMERRVGELVHLVNRELAGRSVQPFSTPSRVNLMTKASAPVAPLATSRLAR